MSYFYALLLVVSLQLSSCTIQQRIPAALDAKVDSALTAAGVPPLRKIKFTGPVTLQIGGAGNNATAIARARGPVAAAPYATATTAKTSASPPWWVYLGIAGLALAGGFVLRDKLKIALPF